jgi:hypothetical protein
MPLFSPAQPCRAETRRSQARPQPKKAPEAFISPAHPKRAKTRSLPLGYVEDASEVRTKLAAIFSSRYSVWTSTDSTAGRSRTIGAQLSPPSDDPYTCPPVVPKYSPHGSSESTDIASRKTFT